MSKETGNPANNIEQIRDLIFGPQMADYNHKFETLQEEVAEIKKQFQQSFKELNQSLQALKQENEKERQELAAQMNRGEDSLQRALEATEKHLVEMIRELETASANRERLASYLIEMGNRLMGREHLDSHPQNDQSSAEG